MDRSLTVECESIDMSSELDLETVEARAVEDHAIVTDGRMSWSQVCRSINAINSKLPYELRATYRLWLLTKPIRLKEVMLSVEELPRDLCESRGYLPQGLYLPYPSGPHWRKLVSDEEYRRVHGDRLSLEEEDEERAYQAMRILTKDLKSGPTCLGLAMLSRAALSGQATIEEIDSYLNSIVAEDIEAQGYRAYASRKIKRKSVKVMGSGEEPPPKTIIEALMGDRAEEWVASIHSEFKGLCDQGVFSHDWTLDDLHEAGIRGKPIPCSIALTHKYKDGILTRLKTRICIAGHRGNVTRGIHYHEVFSPSPVQHTEKLLQAMRVHLHLQNLAWDIKQAYTWAPLPKGERVAVIYPDGFKRTNAQGDELYLVLERNLYGMPSASRGWGQHRDKFILRHFNLKGWSCSQSVHDPCLFVIDKHADGKCIDAPPPEVPDATLDLPSNIHRSWILIHTDDCDAYGTSLDVLHEINSAMNDEWATEVVDESFILGVKREVSQDPKGWHVTLTMTSYIEELAGLFKSHLDSRFGKRSVRTPFPEGLILTKANEPREGEVDRNIKRGYQRLVGSLLWCVRHVLPIASYGMSQLCKLMATPTDEAWDAALWLLAYAYRYRNRGIRFTESDSEPLAFVDASNKDDPVDGKTQYAYSIHWGGPLIVKSSKLAHVGINSTYNEYMALHFCIKQIVWLRQLMEEIGLGAYVSQPTMVYADNRQANNLCREEVVTAGNMYFRTGYHYNKEAVRDKYVSVHYCPTDINIIDAGTKALGPIKIEGFEPQLHGFKPLPEVPDE